MLRSGCPGSSLVSLTLVCLRLAIELHALPVQNELAQAQSEKSSGTIKMVNAELAVVLELYRAVTKAELIMGPGTQLFTRVTIESPQTLSADEIIQLIEQELGKQCGFVFKRIDGNRISVTRTPNTKLPVAPRVDVAIAVRALDAETSAPLPTFRVFANEKRDQKWGFIGEGSSGVFRSTNKFNSVAEVTFEIRAEGYMPQTTAPFRASGDPISTQVLLRRAAFITGRILDPDGQPAVRAKVFLAGKTFGPKSFAHPDRPEASLVNLREDPDKETLTDDLGQFNLPPAREATHVIVEHELGCAAVSLADLTNKPAQLQKWARLEGTLQFSGESAAAQVISIRRAETDSTAPRVPHPSSATSDAEGAFIFARLPPGEYRVSRMSPLKGSQRVRAPTHSITIVLAAGSTSRVVLDESAALPQQIR